MTDLDSFEPVARIIVIGVGGAGNNAVNRMIDEEINNVEFYVANTDKQALSTSKAPHRIVLGEEITKGLGAGGDPKVGAEAAEKSADEIRRIVEGADMVFIAAGMGKGTGTGAAPVIARIAKESGALTVAIVTRPFTFEGSQRVSNAVMGLGNLKDAVDSIIIVSNDKLLAAGGNSPVDKAFEESDRVLAQSVKTVADLILVPSQINLDFADVRSTLKDSGMALIGYGIGSGPKRAEQAAEDAINSPLLEASISGSRRAICALSCGQEVTLFELQECVRRVTERAGGSIDVKLGVSTNPTLKDSLIVSVIASDFADEFDFTSPPSIEIPRDRKVEPILPFEEPSGERDDVDAPTEEGDLEEAILPDFLKNGF